MNYTCILIPQFVEFLEQSDLFLCRRLFHFTTFVFSQFASIDVGLCRHMLSERKF